MPLTISAATPHVRFTEPKKRAQLSPEDRKDRQEARADKQALIDSAVTEWFSNTMALAEELATRHKLKPQYFLDLFFQGGARMIHQQKKVNPYTAFKAEKSAECRERGESKKVPELHEEYFDEYKNLTDEEKQDIVDRYTESHGSRTLKLRRDTPHAKIQYVSNIIRNMKLLMVGLASHVGAEGFFCVVRNSSDFHMEPQWYFTSRELEEYMPIATRKRWVTTEVGTKLEAFSVAGCNILSLLRTSKMKADYLKALIRDSISASLIAITGATNAQMSWVWYEEDIVQKYSIILVGWTFPELANPSTLSTSLPALQELHDALKNGDCHFKKLTPEELADRKKNWLADVNAGRRERKHRAERCDKGVKRSRAQVDDKDENDKDDEGGEDDDEGGEEGTAAPTAPPRKRPRITATHPQVPEIEEPQSDAENPAPKEVPVAPRKSRKAPAKKTPARKTPAAKKPPAAKKVPAAKKAPRDDEVTRAAAARMKKDSADRRAAQAAQQAAQQGPAAEVHDGDVPPAVESSQPRPRRVVKPRVPSNAAITSDDERDLDPDTNNDDNDAYTPPHEDEGNGVAGAAVANDIALS